MSEARPLITVIMPVHNTERYVRAAVESILAQTLGDLELLAIDDGSTDRSGEILLSLPDPRLRTIRRDRCLGPAAARNAGLDQARGRYVAFFDSDDIAAPARFDEQVGFISRHPGFRMIASRIRLIDGDGRPAGQATAAALPSDRIAPTMLFYNCLATSAILIDRAAVADRRFNEDFPIASDYEMWVRILEENKAWILPKPLVDYRVHPANISHRKRELAAEFVQKITRRQLQRLGVEPDASELAVHHWLSAQSAHGTPREAVLESEAWLLKLDAANSAVPVYPTGAFREVLGDYWFFTCHSAAGLGGWTWKKFNASPLRAFARQSWTRRWRLARLALRGMAKRRLLRPDRPRQKGKA